MAFQLAEPPGGIDIPNSMFNAGAGATGFVLSALKDNCAFGSVVPEIFYGLYTNGQTVPLPQSPVDGYEYLQEELIYMWEAVITVDQANGTPSAAGGLLWAQWFVEQNTGIVHTTEAYEAVDRSSSGTTNDGTLGVWTIAIRGRTVRTLSTQPAYTDLPASDFVQDGAATPTILQELSANGKRGAVQCEVFPMNPSNAPTWTAGTNYGLDALVQPTAIKANGFWFIAAVAGKSGSLEPNWPSVYQSSAPIIDGSIVWNIAGAGYYNGQQVKYPASGIDGYEYSSEDTVVPFVSFISTQAMPFQKGKVVYYTSGQTYGISKMLKSIVQKQPSYPASLAVGQGVPGLSQSSALAAPPAPVLSSGAGGSLPATTYYVVITYVDPYGETNQSAESSLAVAANNLLFLTTPAASGDATGYNIYVGTAPGAETLQTPTPVPIGTGWEEPTSGLLTGTAVPSNQNQAGALTSWQPSLQNWNGGYVAPANEALASAFLGQGASATGVGIVACGVNYAGRGTYADGTVMVWLICFRKIAVMASPGGANFTDLDIDQFMSGNPLRYDYMQDINENAKFSILRPEIFVNAGLKAGATVPVPTSPIDSYAYSREELTYMWFWTDSTGPFTAAEWIRDLMVYVDPQNGILNTRVDFVVGSNIITTIIGEQGFERLGFGFTGTGIPVVTVIVFAQRSHETQLESSILINSNLNTTPAPPSPNNLIPNGNFEIWPIIDSNAFLNYAVADDWGVLQDVGGVEFLQYPYLNTPPALDGLYSQAIAAICSGTSLAQRQSVTPPGGTNIASIASFVVPVWPGGQYQLSFLAAAFRVNANGPPITGFTPAIIAYGFYARVHILGQNSAGEPDPTTDTYFDLLGNISLPAGVSSSDNPGAGIPTSPPNPTKFQFTFTVPVEGDLNAQTSVGPSVLSSLGAIGFQPAFAYLEFLLWDIVGSDTTLYHVAVLDDVDLIDMTEGSTGLNQQASLVYSADNSQFSYVASFSPRQITFSWPSFEVEGRDGSILTIPASTAMPVSPVLPIDIGVTTAQVSAVFIPSLVGSAISNCVQFYAPGGSVVYRDITTFLFGDGNVPLFENWPIAIPGSGTSSGSGTPGGYPPS